MKNHSETLAINACIKSDLIKRKGKVPPEAWDIIPIPKELLYDNARLTTNTHGEFICPLTWTNCNDEVARKGTFICTRGCGECIFTNEWTRFLTDSDNSRSMFRLESCPDRADAYIEA